MGRGAGNPARAHTLNGFLTSRALGGKLEKQRWGWDKVLTQQCEMAWCHCCAGLSPLLLRFLGDEEVLSGHVLLG